MRTIRGWGRLTNSHTVHAFLTKCILNNWSLWLVFTPCTEQFLWSPDRRGDKNISCVLHFILCFSLSHTYSTHTGVLCGGSAVEQMNQTWQKKCERNESLSVYWLFKKWHFLFPLSKFVQNLISYRITSCNSEIDLIDFAIPVHLCSFYWCLFFLAEQPPCVTTVFPLGKGIE